MLAWRMESSVDMAAAAAPARMIPVSHAGAYRKRSSGKTWSGISSPGRITAPPSPTSAAGM